MRPEVSTATEGPTRNQLGARRCPEQGEVGGLAKQRPRTLTEQYFPLLEVVEIRAQDCYSGHRVINDPLATWNNKSVTLWLEPNAAAISH